MKLPLTTFALLMLHFLIICNYSHAADRVRNSTLRAIKTSTTRSNVAPARKETTGGGTISKTTLPTIKSGLRPTEKAMSPSLSPSSSSSYPKKVISLKKRPTKNPISSVSGTPILSKAALVAGIATAKKRSSAQLNAAFKDLPADDLEFIKELDKQFQMHGDKIKIKVEHENATTNGVKNSKRTIDGELGYGYQDNNGVSGEHNGYDYSRPKFMFYPYSQNDIPADAPGYYPPTSVVDIEPSYSYELKPHAFVTMHAIHQQQQQQEQQQQQHHHNHGHQHQHQQHHHQHHHHQHDHDDEQQQNISDQPQIDLPSSHGNENGASQYEEPVIVLRIPGPAKYALHLRALLQQYLEIRAAQYLQIIEEAEARKQQQEDQHYQQQLQQHRPQQLQHEPQQLQHEQQQHEHNYETTAAAGLHTQVDYKLQQQQQQQQHLSPPPLPTPHSAHDYTEEGAYVHQVAPTPQPVLYPDINDVYQSYKGRHSGVANHQQSTAVVYHDENNADDQGIHKQQQHEQQHGLQHDQQHEQQHEQQHSQQHDPQHDQQHEQQHVQQHDQQHDQQHEQQHDQQHVQHHEQHHQQQIYADQGEQQYYFTHQQIPNEHVYQQLYFISMSPDGQAYNEPEQHHQQQQSPLYADIVHVNDGHLPDAHALEEATPSITENNPRKTHTKVIFTPSASDHSGGGSEQNDGNYENPAYALPLIQNEPPAAAFYQQPLQQYHNYNKYNHQQQHDPQEHDEYNQQHDVTITQRPFNYHAHVLKPRTRSRTADKRSSTSAALHGHAKRNSKNPSTVTSMAATITVTSAPGTLAPKLQKTDEQQYQKIREFVRDNLGARMGKAVEFQTRQVVEV